MALDTPGVDDKFRLPRGNGDQTILNAARAFARDAAPLSPEFVKHDMPDDFLADLQSDIDAFEEAIRDHETGKDTHVAARAGIETAIDAGIPQLMGNEDLEQDSHPRSPCHVGASVPKLCRRFDR